MLSLDNLHKRYEEVVALDGAALTAHRGRILGFLGPNGAGKTTAMRAVFGLVALDSGSVTWEGAPITPASRLRFGYMPERRGLYPKMSIRRQVSWLGRLRGMTGRDADAATMQWLERLGLAERADDRVEQLSHGNQQRAQLAASLVHDPDLIVLDEPFSGLDPMGVDAMSNIVRQRATEGAAVLFSSHQLDLVEDLCDDVAIIDHGHMVATGPVEAIRSNSPHRRLEVGFEDSTVNWRPAGEAAVVSRRGGVTVYLVPADTDPATLLESAGAAGKLSEFTFVPPRLSDVFRAAVAR